MKDEYDFSNARRNPYTATLKQTLLVPLDDASAAYFQTLAEEMSMPVAALVSLYLKDCAEQRRRPSWEGL